MRKYPPELKVQARNLRRQGMTNRAIGERLGIGSTTIDYWCRGVRRPPLVRNCRLCKAPFATRRKDGTYCQTKNCATVARQKLGWRVYGQTARTP